MKVSAPLHQGIEQLKYKIWERVQTLPEITVFEQQYVPVDKQDDDIIIERENNIYYVSGERIEKIIGSVNFDDYESRMYFERALKKAGVYELLELEGIQDGDTVDVLGHSFDYVR